MAMKSERTVPVILGGILLAISALLVARFPPRVLEWGEPIATSPIAGDLVLLAFPIIGTWSAIEFLRKDGWGWAGILFHLVIFYVAIGYAILAAVDIVTAAQQALPVMPGILDVVLAGLGWFGLLLYYD